MRAPRFIRTGAAVVVLATAGCVATEQGPPARGVVVSGPPPAPLAEPMRSPPPSPASVWVPGYWHWTGVQYAWIPGHWENAPPGTAWAAPRYVSSDGAFLYEAGAWKPAPAAPPPAAPPARANALR